MSAVAKRLSRTMTATIARYGLVGPGDRILVAISGGKDSYTLLDLLWRARARAPFGFDLVAVHLDQGQPGYDGTPLRRWLEASKIPFEIVREDTYSVVRRVTPEGGTFCAACSRLRRGVLYSTAERLGCNKIALGHHRDDALETLLLNLFYGGRLAAMPARYRTADGRFEVIRPLVECAERDIAAHAEARSFPILPCNLCGSQEHLARKRMKALLDRLEAEHPAVRDVMLAALRNVEPEFLLDPARIEPPAGVGERPAAGAVPARGPMTPRLPVLE